MDNAPVFPACLPRIGVLKTTSRRSTALVGPRFETVQKCVPNDRNWLRMRPHPQITHAAEPRTHTMTWGVGRLSGRNLHPSTTPAAGVGGWSGGDVTC